jgi:NADPH2:quinone reductase
VLGEQVHGSHAEYVAVPARNLERVPDGVPAQALVATCGSWLTAWRALIVVARLQAGETLAVMGASGGVGTAALRIAKLAGARVVAVTRGRVKCRRAEEEGADVAIDYGEGPFFREAVQAASGGRGIHVVLDSVGAATWRESINLLRPFGRLVICGATSGDAPEISIREIYQQHRQILGAPLGSRSDFRDLARVVFDGLLRPIVHDTFRLEDIHDGLRLLQSREVFGKVVVTP